MTDVACLLLAYPAAASNIKEVIALIGSKPGPVIYAGKPARDFNHSMDPRALSVILDESEVPFTAVTFEASSSAALPTDIVSELAQSDDPTASYFGKASQAYTDWWASIFGPTKPIWDAVAVWQYLHPEDFDCSPARYELQLGPPDLPSDSTHDWFIPDPEGGSPGHGVHVLCGQGSHRPHERCSSRLDQGRLTTLAAAMDSTLVPAQTASTQPVWR